ncbi:MAG TPA: hypothetical protein VIK72_05785 [Clostridiaceae bacterium]
MDWSSISRLILPILLLVIVEIFIFTLFRIYLMPKIKINKWIIIIVAFVVILLPSMLGLKSQAIMFASEGAFIFLFLWFMELTKFFKPKTSDTNKGNKTKISNYKSPTAKKDNYVMKPKAKPNRAKNLKK